MYNLQSVCTELDSCIQYPEVELEKGNMLKRYVGGALLGQEYVTEVGI